MGRPRRLMFVCDHPSQRDDEPIHGPSQRLLEPVPLDPATLSPLPNLNPDLCWFWAGAVFVDQTPVLTHYRSRSRPNQPYRILPSIKTPPHLPQTLANLPPTTRLCPCLRHGRFAPWPGHVRLYLSCINPHHRPPIPSPTTSSSSSPSHPPSLRDYHDLLRDLARHPAPNSLSDILALSPILALPPDPPYSPEEIVSHLHEANRNLDLPRAWRAWLEPYDTRTQP